MTESKPSIDISRMPAPADMTADVPFNTTLFEDNQAAFCMMTVISLRYDWSKMKPSEVEKVLAAHHTKYGTFLSPFGQELARVINDMKLKRASSRTAFVVFERVQHALRESGRSFRLDLLGGRKNRKGRRIDSVCGPISMEGEMFDVPLAPAQVLEDPTQDSGIVARDCGYPVLVPQFELRTRGRIEVGLQDTERRLAGNYTMTLEARWALALAVLCFEAWGAKIRPTLRAWALKAGQIERIAYIKQHGKPPPRGPRDPERALERARLKHMNRVWNGGLTFTAHEQPAVLKQLARKPIDAARRQVIEDNGYLAGQGYDPGQPHNAMPILKLESLFHLFPKPHLERYSSNGSERSFSFKVGDDKLARKAKTAIIRGDGMVVVRLTLLNTLLPPQLGDTNIFDVELRFSTTTWPWRLWSHEPPHEELWIKALSQDAGREDATRWLKRSLASKPKALEYSGFYELQRAQAAMGFTLGRRQFLPPIQELLNEVVKELELGARDRTALSQFTDHYIACEEAERSFFEAVGGMKVVVGPSKVHGYMHNGGPSWRNVNVLMNLALKNAFAVRASAVPPTDEELGA